MTVQGSCHFGATRFVLKTSPIDVTQCNCSLCAKRGALWSYYRPEEVEFLSKEDAVYLWRTKTVKHHHCPTCGCATFSESPLWQDGKRDLRRWRYGVNVRLLDDFAVEGLPVIEVDGRSADWYATRQEG